MTIAVNTATIRRFYEAMNLGDLAAAAECIAPDFFDHALTMELAYGREGFLLARTRSRHMLADITIQVQQLLATRDNYVVARVLIRAKHVGDYLHIPATGRAFTMEAISIMRLHHGLIAEHWESSDVPGLLTQLHGRIVVEEESVA